MGLPQRSASVRRRSKYSWKVEVGALVLKAGGNELGDGLDHGQVGARELVGLHQIGVEAPCHGDRRGGLAVHGELGDHGRARGELRLAAKGHEHGRARRWWSRSARKGPCWKRR